MGAQTINIVRSCLWHDQKKLTIAAIIICWIIIAIDFSRVLKPFTRRPLNNSILRFSNSKTDVYDLSGDVRIKGRSATIFIASKMNEDGYGYGYGYENEDLSQTVKPLPRKQDVTAMAKVRGFTMKWVPADTLPHCTRNLDAPAILFSTGHTGNYYHRITDVLIPLFATSYHFHRHVILLVTDNESRLTSEHRETLEKLSEYKVYDIDVADEILCFSRMIVGLKAQPFRLSIDPSLSPNSSFSMRNFTKFMRDVHSLGRASVHEHPRLRPRMLIITRNATRRLINHAEVADLARSLGFEPVAREFGGSMGSVARLVNGFDVLVGVHGAGLANMVFLPENAVVIQITPLGLEGYAEIYFGKNDQLEEMKLKYLEYKVTLIESTLAGKYPPHSDIYKHPFEICIKKFQICKDFFLDNQDVTLDLHRFRKTLLQALDLLAPF